MPGPDRGAAVGRALDAKRTKIRGLQSLKLERFDKNQSWGVISTVEKWWDLQGSELKIIEQPTATARQIQDAKAFNVDGRRLYPRRRPKPFAATRKWVIEVTENVNERAT